MVVAVWSLGGELNSARRYTGGCGLQSAGLVFGGVNNDSPDLLVTTEDYSGTSWAAGGDLPVGVDYHAGAGISTAGLCISGRERYATTVATKEYNGTTWSSGGDVVQLRFNHAAAGLQDAALIFGGEFSVRYSSSEEYNGNAWSLGGDMSEAKTQVSGCGSQSAGLVFNGNPTTPTSSGYTEVTEEYNGTTWALGGNFISDQATGYAGGAGTAQDALSMGGSTLGNVSFTYNGTVWSVGSDMVNTTKEMAGFGTGSAALSAGGHSDGAPTKITEEYNFAIPGNHRGISGIDGGVLFNGKTIIGDRANGKLYAMDMNVYTDNGQEIERIRRTQIINKKRVQVLHHAIEVEFEAGVGLDVAEGVDGEDPQALLRWSDDGGNIWSEYRSVDIGEYQQYGTRAIWRQLGMSRNRIYELKITDPVKVVLIGADARLTPCRA